MPKVRSRSAEQLAADYYTSDGSAIGAAVRGGGNRTGDFLSEHGMIEHRVKALSTGKYDLVVTEPKGKGCAVVAASFQAVRKRVCEHVQLLSKDELVAFLAALHRRGSSRRSASMGHLLTPEAMAARSPAVLWSVVHAFDGDVHGGVLMLQQLATS